MPIKIVTEHIYPPIPDRRFDWAAHYDDHEGSSAYGRTEQEAIQNLVTDHPRCKDDGGYVDTDGECLVCDADAGISCRKSAPVKPATEGCSHANYKGMTIHGRCCPDCGTFMMDAGD